MTREVLVGGPASVQRELFDHFVSNGEAARIASHEAKHANADREGSGVFGVILVPAILGYTRQVIEYVGDVLQVVEKHINEWVEVARAAFYRPDRPRSNKVMAQIASAPGFADMSGPDWEIYNDASAAYAREQREERRVTAQEMREHEWAVIWQAPKGEKKGGDKPKKTDSPEKTPEPASTKKSYHSLPLVV